jgi:ankyrin repeat protein
MLLDAEGVDIEKASGYSDNLLHIAVEQENSEIVRMLLDTEGTDVSARETFGRTALHIAVVRENTEIIRMLTDAKIDVNARSSLFGAALHVAIDRGNVEILRMLIGVEGIDVNVASGSIEGTALHVASNRGNVEIVRMLLGTEGIDVNARGGFGRRALHCAARNGSTKIVEMLLAAKGINVNLQDNQGQTVLEWAIQNGNIEISMLLLFVHVCEKYGGDIDKLMQEANARGLENGQINKYIMKLEMVLSLLELVKIDRLQRGPGLTDGENKTPIKEPFFMAFEGLRQTLKAWGRELSTVNVTLKSARQEDIQKLAMGIWRKHYFREPLVLCRGIIKIYASFPQEYTWLNNVIVLGEGSQSSSTSTTLEITKERQYPTKITLETALRLCTVLLQDSDYSTNAVLQGAVENGHTAVVALMLAKGVEIGDGGFTRLIELANQNGHTNLAQCLKQASVKTQAGSAPVDPLAAAEDNPHDATAELEATTQGALDQRSMFTQDGTASGVSSALAAADIEQQGGRSGTPALLGT